MKISNFLVLIPLLALAACHHDDDKDGDRDTSTCPTDTGVDTGVDTADTSVTATCTDSVGTHAVGDSWTCPDGCNTCTCVESDVITSTDMACGDTGDTAVPPDTGAGDTGGADTSTPTDTGASDTGSSTDTATSGR